MRQDKNNAVHTRNRTIEWRDPGAVREQADGLSVLDIMRGIRDGTLPPPPIACLIGFHYIEAEPGQIVIELEPEQSLENSAGTLHAGVAAAVTLDLKISYLMPLTIESGPIRAIGRVVDHAEPTAYVTGQIRDGAGSLAVHAVGVISVITSEQAQSGVPGALSIKPGMWSTIQRTLNAMAS